MQESRAGVVLRAGSPEARVEPLHLGSPDRIGLVAATRRRAHQLRYANHRAESPAIERDLVDHITQFLVELGSGFAYVGRQVPIEVDGSDFFVDLLFYHVRLHCFVVIELKTVDFQPEFAGKLNFYLTAVDELMRGEGDGATIGLLLCKNRRGLVAEYALRDINKPMGVSTYTLSQALPEALRDKLPSIEALEQELGLGYGG